MGGVLPIGTFSKSFPTRLGYNYNGKGYNLLKPWIGNATKK